MEIVRLATTRHWIPTLAGWHFDHWGKLTGFERLQDYVAALEGWSEGREIPTVLAANQGGQLLGSVNVLRSEMTVRPALTPWLAQLFVVPGARRGGIGAALTTAAIGHARACGFSTLYLYTSGTLPRYYARLGWAEVERVEYLGRERVVMRYVTTRP